MVFCASSLSGLGLPAQRWANHIVSFIPVSSDHWGATRGWACTRTKKQKRGIPVVAQQVEDPPSYPWGCRFHHWPWSVGWGSGITLSCGVGQRRGSWTPPCDGCPLGLQLQLWFDPSPGNCHMRWGPKKQKANRKKNKKHRPPPPLTELNIKLGFGRCLRCYWQNHIWSICLVLCFLSDRTSSEWDAFWMYPFSS